MPLRTSSGISSGAFLAAAAPAAAAMPAAARYAGVHDGIGGERGGAGGDGGEAGDQTPRLRPAALGALGPFVGRAHGAHQLEPLLALGALVLVESHKSHLSVNGCYLNLHCTLYGKIAMHALWRERASPNSDRTTTTEPHL